MTTELYWVSKTVVVDWKLAKLDGTPASDATAVGVVNLPAGGTASMPATWIATDLVWRFTYDPAAAGLHTYRISATGTADSVEEGKFYVNSSLTAAPPITLDPSTAVGLARLLATDVDEAAPVFTDAQWSGFLTVNGGNARRAAAQGLEAVAASEVLVSKVIRTQDLATDGAKVSAELRALAQSLRDQADAGWGNDGLDAEGGGFTVVDFDPSAGATDGELAELAAPWWMP